jgi:hypothetical protein
MSGDEDDSGDRSDDAEQQRDQMQVALPHRPPHHTHSHRRACT